MKFYINKKDLVNIFTEFSSILKDNSVRPILSGIFIEAKLGKLTFIGTNLEVDLIKSIDCNIIKEGNVVLKPALILEYVKLLDIDNIEINLENNILYIHNAEFSVLNGDEYPQLSKLNGTDLTSFNPLELKNNFDKVKFAASVNNDNLAINTIRLNIKSEYIDFVATDSFRLICQRIFVNNLLEKELSLPLESVIALQKLINDNISDTIKLSTVENYAIFTWENTYFSTRVIELNYPDYEGIFNNSSYSKTMEFNNSQIKTSLKKVISISKSSSELKFGAIFNFKNKKLEIKTSSGNAKLTEKLDMIKEGEDFVSSINSKFLLDFISITNKNIIIKGNNSHSMFEIREFGNDDYTYILMPLAMRS